MSTTDHGLPVSEHFVLEPLAEGVYAAIATEGGLAFSNAGIVDLGERTLIFDTFDSIRAAEDLQAAAEQLTGRPASYVVISHWHPDHWSGNQLFVPRASIIATPEIREQMIPVGKDILEFQQDPSETEGELRECQECLEGERDPGQRRALERTIVRIQQALEELPRFQLCLPDQTFEGTIVFQESGRRAELHCWGAGHTSSDVFLVLPEEGIVFLGDLGFFASQPFMAYADPPAWREHTAKFEQSANETFVPGHGPVGTKQDLALQREYIAAVEDLVGRVALAGGTVEDALAQPLPEQFQGWTIGSARFEANVRALYQRLSGP